MKGIRFTFAGLPRSSVTSWSAQQWVEAITRFAPELRVCVLEPKNKIGNLENVFFYIVNPHNISKIDPSIFSTIKFFIADELHQIITPKLCQQILCLHPLLLLGLSATPYRSDCYDKVISWFFGSDIISKELYHKHSVCCIRTTFIPKITINRMGLDWNEVLNSQATNNARNELIVDIIAKYPNRVWLILVKRKLHIDLLQEKFTNRGIDCETLMGTKKTFDKNIKILMGTTSKIGVGFDHAEIDALLIASDIKEYFIQFLGRCMRREDVKPIIIDIVDNFHPLIKHFHSRSETYKKHGGKIETIYTK